jgi:hypothetical protein
MKTAKFQILFVTTCILSMTIQGCKKKTIESALEEQKQEIASESTPVYRPKKVFISRDSLNYQLKYEYDYDVQGRIQQLRYFPDSIEQPFVIHILSEFTYQPQLIVAKNRFLNKNDNAYYFAGYDSTILNSNGNPIHTVKFGTYQSTSFQGNDTLGLKVSQQYSYLKKGNTSEISSFGNVGYNSEMGTTKYTLDSLGNIMSVLDTNTIYTRTLLITENQREGIFIDPLLYLFAGVTTRIVPKNLPAKTMENVKYGANSPYTEGGTNVWLFDSQARPIWLSNTKKRSDGNSSKLFVKFEY